MSELKHTPWPWEASLAANSAGQRHIYDASGNPIAVTVYNDVERPEQIAANARLIASAPDLLEALTAMLAENGALHVNSINSDSPAEKLARAAIKKATGT